MAAATESQADGGAPLLREAARALSLERFLASSTSRARSCLTLRVSAPGSCGCVALAAQSCCAAQRTTAAARSQDTLRKASSASTASCQFAAAASTTLPARSCWLRPGADLRGGGDCDGADLRLALRHDADLHVYGGTVPQRGLRPRRDGSYGPASLRARWMRREFA